VAGSCSRASSRIPTILRTSTTLAGTGDRSAKFNRDGASYVLYYKVAQIDI